MNEGESAGGGHQGSIPAPPAVPDRRSTISTTTIQPTTATNNSNNKTSSLSPNILTTTIVANTASASGAASPTPLSFQQVFTQQQHPQKQQSTAALVTQQQQLHMPLTPTPCFTVAPGAATFTGTASSSHYQPQQHQPQYQALINFGGGSSSSYRTPLPSATATPTTTVRNFVSSSTSASGVGGAGLASESPPVAKRQKIDNTTPPDSAVVGGAAVVVVAGGSLLPTTAVGAGFTPADNNIAIALVDSSPQDLNTLKKRLLEQQYLRLRKLKEKHSENVAELFYLQSGGNMMDFPTWRKKPPTPQFITFSNAYRLDQSVNEDRSTAATAQSQQNQLQEQTDNIATIIGVSAGNNKPQPQQQECISAPTINTNTQSQLASQSSSTVGGSVLPPNRNLVGSNSSPTSESTTTTLTTGSGVLPPSSTDASSNVLPQGAEIKIPAVGATPVAVSTKLPAAVVQLTQQGHIPGRPLGGRHGMVFGQISAPPAVGNSSVPLVPGGTPLVPFSSTTGGSTSLRRNGNGISQLQTTAAPATGGGQTPLATPPPNYSPTSGMLVPVSSTNGAGGSLTTATTVAAAAPAGSSMAGSGSAAQEFSFKAKQEVYVMQRISELQREGLWTEKRLPKLQEPSRPKAHWDYLLEEMVWLAADFAQERKWKKNAAKKCAKMVQKYFQDKANAAQRAEKAQEAHLKRVAAFIAKEVKMFWSNVEKLVEYKHLTKIEEKRKKALDQHLSFIVDQTEKFSQQLVEGMNKSNAVVDSATSVAAAASATPSINSSRISSPKRPTNASSISDDEFRPESASDDDEETIAKAEEESVDVKEEVAALEKESQLDLDDFIKDLPEGYLENRDKIMLEEEKSSAANKNTEDDDTDDAEFEADEASEDDENTISKQEEEEMNVDHKKELHELEADNDLTVEQLLAKYKSGKVQEDPLAITSSKMEVDSDDDDAAEEAMVSDENSTEDETEDNTDEDDTTPEEESSSDESDENDEQENGLKSLLEDTDANSSKDDMIKDAAALAESIQPKGNTLSSTNVVTPVPFLLKHSLREYQHIGLDWLVTMNERKLNGILADEMGLGKTIQTIALLAHLACVKGNWGPHLIVVPSSVMLNWEMEFKKWCPGFKILTYYGTQKERKLKRVGWTKPNAFHVCITSYKLVVQDQQSFRRKKWKYLILDEAQNIKNFKSQRWQLLLNFSTERRLLLTGTPLQNDLMELWSLMHFLMPYVFSSHREFKEWFSNPMTGMIEGNMEYNESLINRLHKVIRPFLLRRLKKEVEKQMPKKYEHIIMCRLSNRQRYLYDDFMSRAKTKETLQTGNLLSVINILMQLRKVCNHPNMFEVRPTISPFQMEGVSFQTARLVCDVLQYDPFTQINLHSMNLLLIHLEQTLTAYVSHKSRQLAPARKLIEEIDTMQAVTPPRCPTGKYKFHIRVRDPQLQRTLSANANASGVRVGASPAMKTEGNRLVPVVRSIDGSLDPTSIRLGKRLNSSNINPVRAMKTNMSAVLAAASTSAAASATLTRSHVMQQQPLPSTAKIAKLVQAGTGAGKPLYLLTTSGTGPTGSELSTSGRLALLCKPKFDAATPSIATSVSTNLKIDAAAAVSSKNTTQLAVTLAQQVKTSATAVGMLYTAEEVAADMDEDAASDLDPIYNMRTILQQRKERRLARLKTMASVNRRRAEAVPIYGADCRTTLQDCAAKPTHLLVYSSWASRGYTNCLTAMRRRDDDNWTLQRLLKTNEQRCVELRQTFADFVLYVPPVCAPRIRFYVQAPFTVERVQRECQIETTLTQQLSPKLALLHPIVSAMTTQFPDPRLIQYDCGKLQTLDRLLRQLKSGSHRVLIFTQMTKMLDVLEAFLNYHGHIYLRLDGSTRVEQRQVLMERFNGDKRIFCFILSTRSGGVGINLTGADTVIFYDSDWNPTMDAQAQDRCHRIGQTRDVHIYRLVSDKTIEVNILKKANQKRMLSDMAIEGGNFTTSFFKSSTIKDLFNMDAQQQDQELETAGVGSTVVVTSSKVEKPNTSAAAASAADAASIVDTGGEIDLEKQSLRAFESALAAAEDEQDVQATKTAKAEAAADLAEFDENIPIDEAIGEGGVVPPSAEMSKADLEVQNLVKQLSPIERYAMRFVEETGADWAAQQLRAADAELEAQKREWEANRQAALAKEEELLQQEAEADELLTYNRKDANNQIWISDNNMEQMPMWCPPTPPQNDNDIYIDFSLTFMYEMECIPETELPPVYVKKDYKRSRSEAGYLIDGNRRPPKIRREDTFFAPRSLFDRPSAALARIRRDLKNQRYRGVFKPNFQIPGLKPPIQTTKPLTTEPEGMAEWSIFEDIAILHVLVNLQGLPCSLMLLSPGHTPNWDLVAEIVNYSAKTYRSPKQCRWRYEAVIQPREEGKLVESPKKPKKLKTGGMKSEYLKSGSSLRCLRSAQMYANDNNGAFTKLMRSRFDCIKTAYLKKAPPPKRHFSTPSLMNPKHMEVLQEFGVVNYDQPISPLNIALMKANKLREKQRSQLPPPPPPPPVIVAGGVAAASSTAQQQSVATQQQQPSLTSLPQQLQEIVQQHQQVTVSASNSSQQQLHTQQLQIQHIPTSSGGMAQQSTAILLQHAPTLTQQQQPTSSVTAQTQQQPQLLRHQSSGSTTTSAAQLVKAIVAAPQSAAGLLTAGQMQQLTQQASASATQHVQLQQNAPASVSVVLSTPVAVQTFSSASTVAASTVQQQQQIVSISPQTIVSSSTQVGSIVQTLPLQPSSSQSQSLPQVVSVSQLATVGTVLTTSASLAQQQPGSSTVTTLNTSALRAQRIVATSAATLQDIVLQQQQQATRSSNSSNSPTIVSMSSLGGAGGVVGGGVTPAQFQAAQLRLASMSGSTKGIPVTALQQSGKTNNGASGSSSGGGGQPAHIQLYRQRQQLKVLQATPTQTTSGGIVQTAAGTIIQSSLMQTSGGAPTTVQVQGGQKVAVATVSSQMGGSTSGSGGGVVTSVATVQVQAHQQGGGRTQFIKQVSSGGGGQAGSKQTITRQVGDQGDMLLVKRQVISAHQKAQLLQQGQIFTTTTSAAVAGTGNVQQQQTQSVSVVGSSQQQQTLMQAQSQQQVTPQQIATLVKTSSSGGSSGLSQSGGATVNMAALSHLKPGGQIKVTMANQSQMRQLHLQQHLAMPRKISRMTQIAAAQANATAASSSSQATIVAASVGGQQHASGGTVSMVTQTQVNSGGVTQKAANGSGGGVHAQLVHIQNTKSLPTSVTVQQIQQVMRQGGQPGTLAATGLVLGKTSVGRVIPVSVASQPNQRQTIQVVSAASAQALAAGNIRAHVAGGQNITGTIKVASAGGGSHSQALITSIQQQGSMQQSQRQNASPVRLQTTAGGNLVAVLQQQQTLQQQNVSSTITLAGGSTTSGAVSVASSTQPEVMTITQTSGVGASLQQQHQQQMSQHTTPQQVRTLVKKKIMQIRSEKE